MNDWTNIVDNGDCVDIILLDNMKAYDTVQHKQINGYYWNSTAPLPPFARRKKKEGKTCFQHTYTVCLQQ